MPKGLDMLDKAKLQTDWTGSERMLTSERMLIIARFPLAWHAVILNYDPWLCNSGYL